MKILGLYNNPCAIPLLDWLKEQGNDVVPFSQKLSSEWCAKEQFDLAISYTYRYILTEKELEALNHNAINIHNSLLPWNRGFDPNMWSIIEGTPRGVSIHYMTTGLDKGEIIAQRAVPLVLGDTLRSSYDRLDQTAKELFREIYPYYSFWPDMKKQPLGKGTYHSQADGAKYRAGISSYDMTAEEYRDWCRRTYG